MVSCIGEVVGGAVFGVYRSFSRSGVDLFADIIRANETLVRVYCFKTFGS